MHPNSVSKSSNTAGLPAPVDLKAILSLIITLLPRSKNKQSLILPLLHLPQIIFKLHFYNNQLKHRTLARRRNFPPCSVLSYNYLLKRSIRVFLFYYIQTSPLQLSTIIMFFQITPDHPDLLITGKSQLMPHSISYNGIVEESITRFRTCKESPMPTT